MGKEEADVIPRYYLNEISKYLPLMKEWMKKWM